jgi:adenylate cyclase
MAALVALLFVPAFAPWVLRFEHWTADWRTAYLSERPATQHPRVALVVINDETLREYPSSPVDRGLLSRIVSAIDTAGARAIGLDILFLKKTEDAKDQALAETLRTAKAQVVLGAVDESWTLEPFQRQFQTSFLDAAGRSVGYLNLKHERDDVVRYAAPPYPGSTYAKSFARLLAAADGPDQPDDGRAIPWLLPPADGSTNFLTIPAQDLLAAGPQVRSQLKDRIVIIGGYFPLRDQTRTPLSLATKTTMPGVAVHAQIVAGLLEPRRAISELGPMATNALMMVLGIAGFLLGWMLWQSAIVDLIGWSFATAVLVAIDALLFMQARILLPFTLALLAWFLGVTAGRSLRVLKERFMRRRRDA